MRATAWAMEVHVECVTGRSLAPPRNTLNMVVVGEAGRTLVPTLGDVSGPVGAGQRIHPTSSDVKAILRTITRHLGALIRWAHRQHDPG